MSQMIPRIDKNAKLPLYCQLKEILLQDIKKMQPDEMITPESMLIERHDVSRTTVRQAIAELVAEGYLYTIRGKGTFVADRKVDLVYMNKIESFAEQVRNSGYTPHTKVLELKKVPASHEAAKYLNLTEGEEVLYLKRLRFADDIPITVVESYLPLPQCERLMHMDLEQSSLYGVLSMQKDTEVRHVRRIIKAGIAIEEERSLLQLEENAVVLYFVNVGYTADETPMEYCVSSYRVDFNVFTVDLYK